MPKVSIIVPTYNRAPLLEKAISSALNQTYTDFELLVCDDGSTDYTPTLVKGFKDKRIVSTRYEKNKGVIGVRNDAILNSRGDYIAFLDDDDEWLPTKLEKQLHAFESGAVKAEVVYTGAYYFDMKLGRNVKSSIPKFRGNILSELLKNNFIITSSIVIKKHCFDKVGLFDPEYRSASDFDMWIRIADDFEFDYVAEPLVKYTINEVSISTNYEAVIRGLERILTKHQNLFENDRKAYVNHLLKLGVAYCYNGETGKGRDILLKAIKLHPSDPRLYYNCFIATLGYDTFKFLKERKKRYISAHES